MDFLGVIHYTVALRVPWEHPNLVVLLSLQQEGLYLNYNAVLSNVDIVCLIAIRPPYNVRG